MDLNLIISNERTRSRGWEYDPITIPFPRIILGDAFRLNEDFAKTYRITHVVNCASPAFKKLDLPSERYECIDAIDSYTVNIFDWYPKFKETMDRFLRDPKCLNVYVHCQAGINRSAFLTIAYIVKTFRVPLDRCIEKLVRQRPCALSNDVFLKQLVDFCKD